MLLIEKKGDDNRIIFVWNRIISNNYCALCIKI